MGSAVADILENSSLVFAQWSVERQAEASPRLSRLYGSDADWFQDWTTDTRARIAALSAALHFNSPSLFVDEIQWTAAAFHARGVPREDLEGNLSALRTVLADRLPERARPEALSFIDRALARISADSEHERCSVAPGGAHFASPHAHLLKRYLLELLESRRDRACELMVAAVRDGMTVRDAYRWVLEPAMNEVGRMWMAGELGVADEHYCTAATQMVMSRLLATAPHPEHNGRVLLAAAVGGDLHDLGIRMVSDLFEMEGWRSQYLGANTPGFAMVEALDHAVPDLIALSAKLIHHLRECESVIRRIRAHADGKSIPILVGGRPFCVDSELWRKIGADGFASSAWEATDTAMRLLANN